MTPGAAPAPPGPPFEALACPVCEHPGCHPFQTVQGRHYGRCDHCEARFLHPAQHPTPEAELAEYRLHQNSADDTGYRRFLTRLADPLLQRLPPAQDGLDFGCGPAPVLAGLLREAGHAVALYDPFFQPDAAALQRRYGFVTCSEVAEHFHHPAAEFRRLRGLLRPGGWLALMTRFQTDDARFADWHYRRDPTHVVFYRAATFAWLACHWGWTCDIPTPNVALLRAPTGRPA